MGGQGRHGQRPVRLPGRGVGVKLCRSPGQGAGVATDLVGPAQPQPTIKGGVLHALGHDRSRGLLEPDPKLVLVLPRVDRRLWEPAAPRQLSDELDAQRVCRRRQRQCGGLGLREDGVVLLLSLLHTTRCEIRAIAIQRHDERLDPGPEHARLLIGQHAPRDPQEPVDLGRLYVLHDQGLALPHDRSQERSLGRMVDPQTVQDRLGPRGRHHLLDGQERVVAGGSRRAPGIGQGLGPLEDLLNDDPGITRCFGEDAQIAGGVGKTVWVVDAEPVNLTVGEERDEQGMRGCEDDRVLHADPDQ